MAEPRLQPDELVAQRGYVRALARRLLLDPHAADDVAQETMLAALERPPPERGILRRWLARIVRNLAYKSLRDTERRQRRERRGARRDETPATSEVVADLQLHRGVVDALLALDEPYRTTLVLHFFEDLPPREIAERQGLPGATVRSHLKRGIDKLRGILDERHGGDRRTWCLALLPLAFPAAAAAAGIGGAATTAGAVVMSMKSKLALIAGLLLAIAALTFTFSWHGERGRADRTAGAAPVAASSIEADTETTEPPGVSWNVEVLVVDAVGEPIAGARVAVLPETTRVFSTGPSFGVQWFEQDFLAVTGRRPPLQETTTGADGRATLALATLRAHRVVATKANHTRAKASVYLRDESREVTLRLGPAHPLSGRVLDAAGAPLPGGLVFVGPAELLNGFALHYLPHHAVADDAGEYRFDAVQARDHSVWAAFPGGMPLYVATIRVPNLARFDITLPHRAMLEGRVTERGTGRALAGIEVRVRTRETPWAFASATTDARGVYRIDTLPAGEIEAVHANGRGYAQDATDGVALDHAVVLSAGGTATLDVELVAAGTIHGVVEGPDGPLDEVLVEAMCQFTHVTHPTFQTFTDDAGRYRIDGLPPSHYLLRASSPGHFAPGTEVDLFQAFLPPHREKLLAVAAGAVVEHPLRLQPGTVAIEGRVEDEQGAPLAGVKVSTVGGGKTLTDAAGAFRLENCIPRKFTFLGASLEGYRQVAFASFDLSERTEVSGALVRMAPHVARRLVGRVVAAPGVALVEPYVELRYLRQGQPSGQARWTRHAVATDGAVDLALHTDTEVVMFKVRAGAVGAGVSATERVRVGREARFEIEFELAAPHSLQGIVVDENGRAVAGARVSVVLPPELGGQAQFRHPHADSTVLASAGADGVFEAHGLAAGTYQVHAWAPDHIDGYVDGVALPAAGPVRVTLEPTDGLAGRVTTPDGQPVGPVLLTIHKLSAEGKRGWSDNAGYREHLRYGRYHNLWTNEKSEFELDGLKRGLYRITVGGYSGGPNVVRTVFDQVESGQRDLELQVEPGHVITGRLIGEGGAAIAGAYISAKLEEKTTGDTRRTATTAADGTFRIDGLEKGLYTLAIRQGNANRSVKREHVATGTKNLVIGAIDRFLSIAGRLLDVDGKPIGGALVVAHDSAGGWTGRRAATDPTGRFEIEGLEEKRYRLKVDGGEFRAFQLTGGEDVEAGTRDVTLRFVSGATITGEVRDESGAAVADAVVGAFAGEHRRAARSGPDGRFEIVGMPAATEVRLRFGTQKHPMQQLVGVRTGAVGLRLVVKRGAVTTARVVDEDGKPLAGVHVSFTIDGGDTLGGATTDEDGRFRCELLELDYDVSLAWTVEGRLQRATGGKLRGGAKDVEIRVR